MIFPESLLRDIRRAPGARHVLLKQLAADDGAGLRASIQQIVDQVPPAVRESWTCSLRSFDNRRFFQALAEVWTAESMFGSGWQVTGRREASQLLSVEHKVGGQLDVMVLSYVRQVRPVADKDMIRRLIRSLDRVGARSRIGLLVRSWLPCDFDPEPVRRAIELWLQEIERGGWDGRYATYDDDNVSLEFALTGGRTGPGKNVVAFAIGPLDGHRSLDQVEREIVRELDLCGLSTNSARQRLLVACVADQPWQISPGYLREFLYGKAVRQVSKGGPGSLESTYGMDSGLCLFRDSLYGNLTSMLFIDRVGDALESRRARVFLNPWAHQPVDPELFQCRAFCVNRWEPDGPVLRWTAR